MHVTGVLACCVPSSFPQYPLQGYRLGVCMICCSTRRRALAFQCVFVEEMVTTKTVATDGLGSPSENTPVPARVWHAGPPPFWVGHTTLLRGPALEEYAPGATVLNNNIPERDVKPKKRDDLAPFFLILTYLCFASRWRLPGAHQQARQYTPK